jgi:hypothetical protein
MLVLIRSLISILFYMITFEIGLVCQRPFNPANITAKPLYLNLFLQPNFNDPVVQYIIYLNTVIVPDFSHAGL